MMARPSNSIGAGGMVIRRSFAAIDTARAASPRSCASMKLARSRRSASLGSPADQSVRVGRQVGLERGARPLERAVHGRDRWCRARWPSRRQASPGRRAR